MLLFHIAHAFSSSRLRITGLKTAQLQHPEQPPYCGNAASETKKMRLGDITSRCMHGKWEFLWELDSHGNAMGMGIAFGLLMGIRITSW